MQSAQEHVHRETLEQEATHATDEARMVLPGVQAVLGFQLIAVFTSGSSCSRPPNRSCTSALSCWSRWRWG